MEKIIFQNKQGQSLAAKIDLPDGEVKAYALFAHCFTCTKDIFGAARIASVLKEKNIAVLRFDFTGLGESEGDFANTNFSSNIDDLVSAAAHMRDHLKAPSILIGHSLGGSAVLAVADKIPEVRAVVTIGSPSNTAHVAHNFADDIQKINDDGEAEVCLAGRPFKIKKQFIDDIQSINLEKSVRNLKRALLVIHAPTDQTVGIENASEIFSWAKHPKSYISLDNADHLLSKRDDAFYAGRIIAEWAAKYISPNS
jgi:pimeloyl-ACP methyl ester carboxylesterase